MKAGACLVLGALWIATAAAQAQPPVETSGPTLGLIILESDTVPPAKGADPSAANKPFEAPLPKKAGPAGPSGPDSTPVFPQSPWDTEAHAAICAPDCCVCGIPGRCWVGAEYLLWWTRGQSIAPLVTTSPAGTPLATAGLLGLPSTTVLLGDERDNANLRSGGRYTAGFWLNREQTLGIEASFFHLETEASSFSASSPGTPIIILPFFDPSGAQLRRVTAYPGFSTGAVAVDTSSRLYGGDVHLLYNLCCNCCWRVDGLIGYRTLCLNEDLSMLDSERDPLGRRIDIVDRFGTSNYFNGCDVGITAQCRHCNWTVDLGARVALGVNDREVSVSGVSTFQTPVLGPITRTGGFFALPTNSGGHSDNEFAFIPELTFKVGYQVCRCLRLTVGYTFLYWPDVARASEQVDTTVNRSQLPTLLTPGGPLVGAARPAATVHDSDFWAHGVSFGLEFRY